MPSFVHLPKTAGTWVTGMNHGHEPVIEGLTNLGHALVYEYRLPPIILDDFLKGCRVYALGEIERPVIAVCRNPYTWLVSAWAHWSGLNDHGRPRWGFHEWLALVLSGEWSWPHPSRPLHYHLFAADTGRMYIEELVRFETLDVDLRELCRRRGWVYKPRGKRLMVGRAGDAVRYWENEALRERVREVWAHDFEVFGYDERDS